MRLIFLGSTPSQQQLQIEGLWGSRDPPKKGNNPDEGHQVDPDLLRMHCFSWLSRLTYGLNTRDQRDLGQSADLSVSEVAVQAGLVQFGKTMDWYGC